MTFLELQRRITQTRKARSGVHNRVDYYRDSPDEEYWTAVYHKALQAANKIVKHYEETGTISTRDKVTINFKDI